MLSFQILDGGDVFTWDLEGRPLLIGAAPDCDIRLQSPGVAAHHARVEPVRRDGVTAYKVVDLGSDVGTRVNGEAIAQVMLAVGDRIEIADATLVLGKRVLRKATPEDVLGETVRRHLPRRLARAPAGARRPWPAIVAGVVAAVLVVIWSFHEGGPPGTLTRVPELLARGDHEEAARLVEQARVVWARGDGARLAVLEGYAAEVARMQRTIAALEGEVAQTAGTRTIGQQIDELRRREAGARDAIERAAVRRVIARVDELRAAARADLVASVDEEQQAVAHAPAAPQPEQSAVKDASNPAAEAPPPDHAAEARAALARGDLRLAHEIAARLPAAEQEQVRAEVAARAEALRREAVAQAEELVALGRGEEASTLLAGIARGLPDPMRGDLEAQARACASVRPAVPDQPAKPAPVGDPLGELLRLVEGAEAAWNGADFARARAEFAAVAERVERRDPQFGAELRARERDCAAVLDLQRTVAERLRGAAKPEVDLGGGERARLIACDGARLRFAGASGEVSILWTELPAPSIDAILRAVDAPADALLGAAVLALHAGDAPVVEQRLLAAARKDPTKKGEVDVLLARARGERVPPSGYEVRGGRFASAAPPAALREIEEKIVAALRGDRKERERVLSAVLDRDPDQLDAVVQILKRQQRAIADRLANHSFRKNWERLAAEREKLDAARQHALELIFDEQRYFYPYKPPAVSSERTTEYLAVQREVDARIEAVRKLWQGSRLRFQIPDGIAADVERYRWLSEVLEGFGELTPPNGRLQWVRALPEGRVLDLRTFCKDAAEVEARKRDARVAKLNAKRAASLSSAEREQLELTNAYRAMMGRRLLALDLRVLAAARGHCEEMERLGYFGHISPVAERRTPYDRMRLAGYAHGGSENIAATDSAAGAHAAWLRSSGHHRNILGEGHTEFACGQRGRLWTQNFGTGRDFERELPD